MCVLRVVFAFEIAVSVAYAPGTHYEVGTQPFLAMNGTAIQVLGREIAPRYWSTSTNKLLEGSVLNDIVREMLLQLGSPR